MDDYGQKPKNTGRKTRAGRIIWETPSGKQYSERTATIPLDVDPKTGRATPNSKWVNVPTVFDGGQILNDEDFLYRFYRENKYVDPITKKKLKFFDSLESAVKAAKTRSEGLDK